jgi:hypothetical protein
MVPTVIYRVITRDKSSNALQFNQAFLIIVLPLQKHGTTSLALVPQNTIKGVLLCMHKIMSQFQQIHSTT